MIYTLTLNPAVDYFVNIETFKEGSLNLAVNNKVHSGGKGINVSRVLNSFLVENKALGFIGGFSGLEIKNNLKQQNISHNFIDVKDLTRINIKVHNLSNNLETEINGAPVSVSKEEETKLFNIIKSEVTKEDILVCSGSINKGFCSNIYKKISEDLPIGAKVVLDTRGNSLIENLSSNLLIKPNIKELAQCFNKKLTTVEDVIKECSFFLDKNIENIIVSMGKEGSLFINKSNIFQALPIDVSLVSSVGAGDSMVAGFLAGYTNKFNLKDCFKLGVASATATVASDGLTTFKLAQDFLKYVNIKVIK